MGQKTEPLNESDKTRLESQRKWVREHFTPESEHLYDSLDQKLHLLDAILTNEWVQPSETVKLQCLGVTLGDAFAQKEGWEWVAVEDEYGRDPALLIPNTGLLLFPMTMISKRIEKGEKVDIYSLFPGIIQMVKEKLAESGDSSEADPSN